MNIFKRIKELIYVKEDRFCCNCSNYNWMSDCQAPENIKKDLLDKKIFFRPAVTLITPLIKAEELNRDNDCPYYKHRM